MQSSIKVIKNSRVIKQGDREISTLLSEIHKVEVPLENNTCKNNNLESYENIASNMLDSANRESERIISKAYVEAAKVKTQAIKEGMQQGEKEGYENGYKDALAKAVEEANDVRAMADDMLTKAKQQYNLYLLEKELHIKDLIVNIAESILKKEVQKTDALNEMIFNCIKAERNVKSYIIKINNTHFEDIKDQIQEFKNKLAFQGDIFVIEDSFLDDGTAVIEKETGKSIVSIAYGIEKIIEVLREEQI